MDAIECLKTRRSIRSYERKDIEKELLTEIIDCGRFAPTARNEQPWEFIIVTDKEKLATIGEIAPNGSFIKDASACIVVICKDTKYYLEDGCAATQNILLAAHALGLGACWIAGDKKPYCEDIKKLFNIPKEYKVVSLISLGYPAEKPVAEKRALEEITHWEIF